MTPLQQSPTISWAGTPGYKVCVAITAPSGPEMIERALACVHAGNLFLELRLDSLPDPRLIIPMLGGLLQSCLDVRLIATCRRLPSGGSFDGSLADELEILEAAASAGCSIVDLALESAEEMLLEQHRILRETLSAAGAALLVSYHDYRATTDLHLHFERVSRHRPEIVKIVSTATRVNDNLSILQLLGQRHRLPIVGIAMGESGIISRVLGPRAGARFTFASSSAGSETAPGQVAAATLRDLYRIDQIGPATRVYGVAGMPIAHSLSPLLHNTGFRAIGRDAVFLPLPTNSIDDLMRLVHELPLDGLSITMPLKQAILPFLDHVDPLAARVGACNTVVRQADGKLYGYNTDVSGVTAPLEKRLSLKGAKALVQGAGGAARAAVFGLREKGADVWILNRTVSTAALLAAESGGQVADPFRIAGESFDVLVNATPSGMQVRSSDLPPTATKETNTDPLPARLIFDMVYRPLETPLIARARAQGLSVITGVEMFVHQGARQFELWTESPAPEAEMLSVVLEALEAAPALSR